MKRVKISNFNVYTRIALIFLWNIGGKGIQLIWLNVDWMRSRGGTSTDDDEDDQSGCFQRRMPGKRYTTEEYQIETTVWTIICAQLRSVHKWRYANLNNFVFCEAPKSR